MLSQQDLAGLLDVSLRAVQTWEQPDGPTPRAKHMRRIVAFLEGRLAPGVAA